ncbi:hypothetical protein H9P43_002816 [Blastocladiella emersonii ATCC 22665]|nr:hypothetical protein H9P43_002816 [Blastocladiella emersonii ATCC 22665]
MQTIARTDPMKPVGPFDFRILPAELWIIVLAYLAHVGSPRDVFSVMCTRRELRKLVQDERVGHAVFLAWNRFLATESHANAPRIGELPISWWAAVRDQARVHGTWTKGDFDVTSLKWDSPSDPTDAVAEYNSAAADNGHLVVTSVRRRQFAPACFSAYYCAHVLSLPDLKPVATLRYTHKHVPNVNASKDPNICVLAVDSPRARFLVLLSFPDTVPEDDDDEAAELPGHDHFGWWYWDRDGGADGMMHLVGHPMRPVEMSSRAFFRPDGTLVLAYIEANDGHAVIATFDSDTLGLISMKTTECKCINLQLLAPLAPDVIALISHGGIVAYFSVETNDIIDESVVTDSRRSVATMLPRPWVRPSRLGEHRAVRPTLSSLPDNGRRSNQFLVAALQQPASQEDEDEMLLFGTRNLESGLRVQSMSIAPPNTSTAPSPGTLPSASSAQCVYEDALPLGANLLAASYHLAVVGTRCGLLTVQDMATRATFSPCLALGRGIDELIQGFGKVKISPLPRSYEDTKLADRLTCAWDFLDSPPAQPLDADEVEPLHLSQWSMSRSALDKRADLWLPVAVEDFEELRCFPTVQWVGCRRDMMIVFENKELYVLCAH